MKKTHKKFIFIRIASRDLYLGIYVVVFYIYSSAHINFLILLKCSEKLLYKKLYEPLHKKFIYI